MESAVTIAERYQETIPVPRAIRFPVELIPPDDFDAERPETWPEVEGRLEYVKGRLLYMPPCGQLQQYTVTDLILALGPWLRAHSEFVLGTDEAGMILGGDARAADAAIWRRSEVAPAGPHFQRVPPVLVAEVAGEDEDETALHDKARWYLGAGVQVVWIVLPESRKVVVIDATEERRCRSGETLPSHPAVPGLAPRVDEFFVQISAL